MAKPESVLYTGAFRFPNHDAAAFRVFSVAQLFQANGCSVTFAGWERHHDGLAHYVYRGYDCFPQNEFRSSEVNPIRRLLGFVFRGHKTIKWIWQNRDQYSMVVAYNPPTVFAIVLHLMSMRVGFKVILDSTEWYESEHLPGGRYGLASLENLVRMRFVYRQFDHVICISSYLSKYFSGRNLVQIPPLQSFENTGALSRPDIRSGLYLIYAGEAGKKDRLMMLIAALPKVQAANHKKVLLHVIGMNWQELSGLMVRHRLNPFELSPFVKCHGRIPREDVMDLYSSCHFSILFRENKRYALAGFPTKAMESFANGCPMITNAVGDLSILAVNGGNAIVLEEAHLSECLPGLLAAVVSAEQYPSMVQNSLKTAKEYFLPSVYASRFSHFLSTVVGRDN